MTSLSTRVAQSPGPDRALDAEVYWRLSEWKNLGGWWREHKVTGERERYGYEKSPQFTASIDAALTVVPDGHGWSIMTHDMTENGPELAAYVDGCRSHVGDQKAPATPALALLSAALKARGL